MRRREWLAVAAGAAAGCAKKEEPKREVTLRVGIIRLSASAGPLFLAMEKGYLREAGLAVQVEQATTTNLHVGALAAGKLDIGLMAMSPAIVNAVTQGAGIRLVMARQNANGVCGAWGQFFARKASFPGGLRDFRELKGKKLAFSTPGSFSDFALDACLEKAGLSRKDVEAISIRRHESVAALLTGRVDAIMQAAGPNDVPAERRGEFQRYPGAELIYPKAQTLYILFGERLRGGERNVGLAFLRAFRRASAEFFGAKFPDFQKKWAEKMGEIEPSYPNCPQEASNGGAVDPESVKLYLDWALRRKLIDAPVAPESVIDATFTRELDGKGAA